MLRTDVGAVAAVDALVGVDKEMRDGSGIGIGGQGRDGEVAHSAAQTKSLVQASVTT